jgi:hypothetical protein
LPRVSALRHVMRNIYDSDTGKTCHQPGTIAENVPSVPEFLSPSFPANPVMRRLVQHPRDWRWSSWGFYFGGGTGLVAIDLEE